MPQLHLLIFKRRSYFPKNGGHWALFLPFEKGGTDGCGFDVIKSSFKAKQTQFKTFDCTPEVGKDRLVECVPLEIYVDDVPDLNNICNIVTRGRPFHLVNQNCQHWVCEVVEMLVERYEIPNGKQELTKIKRKGYRLLRSE